MKQVQQTGQEWKPIVKKLSEQESRKQSSPASEEAGLKAYQKTIEETNRSVKNLQKLAGDVKELLESKGMEETPTRLKSLGTQTEQSGRQLINYAFLRGIMLIGIVFAALLLYRTMVFFCFSPTN